MSNVIEFPTAANTNTNTVQYNDTVFSVALEDAVYEDVDITTLNDEAINDNNRMVWELDTTAAMSVADGEYSVRYTALNADADDSDLWFHYTVESHDKIRVVDGQFDVASVLHTAQHLMDISGYWGVYVEALEYNAEGDYFELVVGS